MSLFNLIMQVKGLLVDTVPEKEVELNFNSSLSGEFVLYLDIKESDNIYSRIKISTYRKFELTGLPSQETIKVAMQLKNKFDALAAINI